ENRTVPEASARWLIGLSHGTLARAVTTPRAARWNWTLAAVSTRVAASPGSPSAAHATRRAVASTAARMAAVGTVGPSASPAGPAAAVQGGEAGTVAVAQHPQG